MKINPRSITLQKSASSKMHGNCIKSLTKYVGQQWVEEVM